MLSGPLSKVDIVIDENTGKFILTLNNIRFGTFYVKKNAEKFGKFLKQNPQYIVTDPQERKSCSTPLRIRLSDKSQPHFGRFKDTHIGLVKTFLKENIIPNENTVEVRSGGVRKRTSGGEAPKRRSSGSGGGGGVRKRRSSDSEDSDSRSGGGGGGGDSRKRRSSGSGGGGDGGEQIFDIRVSQDQKPQRGRQQQQGFLPQYFRGFFDSEQFQERPHNKQTAQKQKKGGEDRYFL